MKLTRKQKIRMARKMMHPQEIKDGVSIWDSWQWNLRKVAIKKRLEK
jgi:hypothetical protein